MDKEELRKFVNQIFKKKGFPPVRNFAKEFADGSKYHSIPSTNPVFLKVLFV